MTLSHLALRAAAPCQAWARDTAQQQSGAERQGPAVASGHGLIVQQCSNTIWAAAGPCTITGDRSNILYPSYTAARQHQPQIFSIPCKYFLSVLAGRWTVAILTRLCRGMTGAAAGRAEAAPTRQSVQCTTTSQENSEHLMQHLF